MKYSVLLFLILYLSCSTVPDQKPIGQTEEVAMNQAPPDSLHENVPVSPRQTFEEWEDSLRNALMTSKPNAELKASILQELYIRSAVNQVKDQFVFELPFDLHGFDCGAPDCYSTDLSFSIPATDPVRFPESITITLFEHGCVDAEKREQASFELKENTTDIINYYSPRLSSNLIIKRTGELYYYPHHQKKSLSSQKVDEIIVNYREDIDTLGVPYQSTTMTTVEYELFLD